MIGALVMAIVILIVLPVAFLMTAALITALMGWWLRRSVEDAHEGSELVDLNI